MTSELQLWFKSRLFKVVPGEDEDTNPGRYGKALTNWLREKLIAMGWVVEDIVAEDWGWCLLVKCEGFRLCVGCGNVDDYDQSASESLLESEQELTWTCFVEAQGPLFARVFRRQQMTTVAIKLFEAIELILTNERAIYPLPGCSGPRVQ